LQGRAVAGDGDDVADLLVRMRNELRRAEGKLQFRGSKDEQDDWFEQQRRLAAEGAR
jgi:predicted flap endonuclease-1-like 5' DNA nuclease